MKKVSTIREALKVLEEARSQNPRDLQSLLDGDFKELKAMFEEFIPEAAHLFSEKKEEVRQKVEDLKDAAHEKIKEKPLEAIGIAALAAFVLGILLGRKL